MLCFRCLSSTQRGVTCRRAKECGINGCKAYHHRLLHATRDRDNSSGQTGSSSRRIVPVEEVLSVSNDGGQVSSTMEEESLQQLTHTSTLRGEQCSELVSLGTVPLWINSNGKKVKINAVLDDASTGTFLNEEVAGALGLRSPYEKVTVRVLNETLESFDIIPVKITLESVDGRTSMALNVHTCSRTVTGSYKVVNWNSYKSKRPHLASVEFPEPAHDAIADILIGVDHSILHRSIVDLNGEDTTGPVARLGPLGWSCMGSPCGSKGLRYKRANFVSTFFIRPQVFDEINTNLKKLWEVENSGIKGSRQESLNTEERKKGINAGAKVP